MLERSLESTLVVWHLMLERQFGKLVGGMLCTGGIGWEAGRSRSDPEIV